MHATPALEERVRDVFVRTLNVGPPADETDLIETGTIDSLALVELLLALEQEFGISIPFDALDIESFRTVATITELVAGLGGAAGEAVREWA